MWKVLIADDEPKIRKGLANAVDWESLGMQVCGLAGNGREALQIMEEQKPDICMVDVCMPLIDGLDFIGQSDNDVIYIVISGFDEFEYARKSVELGVFEYILKPVNEEQLSQTLLRAKKLLEEREKNKSQQEKARMMLKEHLPFLQQRFIQELITRNMLQQEIEDSLNLYHMQFSNRIAVWRIAIQESMEYTEWSQKDRQLKQFVVQNITDETLSKYGTAYLAYDFGEHLAVLMSPAETDDLEEIDRKVRTNLATYLNLPVTVRCREIKNLNELYDLWERWDEESRNNLSPIVARAQEYLEKHDTDSELSVKETADHCGVSVSYLSRIFKAETGTNLIEYLTRLRMQKALYYLENTDLMIYEIAEKVGYKSQHYFCVAFKKVLGISPTEYRQR